MRRRKIRRPRDPIAIIRRRKLERFFGYLERPYHIAIGIAVILSLAVALIIAVPSVIQLLRGL